MCSISKLDRRKSNYKDLWVNQHYVVNLEIIYAYSIYTGKEQIKRANLPSRCQFETN